MFATFQKIKSFTPPKIAIQALDVPIKQAGQIFISEKEYLELKWEIGYWRAMHKKAIAREVIWKQKFKEQEGQIRDLRNRVFGKKSEKKVLIMVKENQKARLPPVLVVSNPAVRGMDVQNIQITRENRRCEAP